MISLRRHQLVYLTDAGRLVFARLDEA